MHGGLVPGQLGCQNVGERCIAMCDVVDDLVDIWGDERGCGQAG